MAKRKHKGRKVCLRCGTVRNLSWHHVYPKRYFGSGWVNSDVRPLCRHCHDELEKLIPYKPKLEKLAYLAIFYTFLEEG